MRTLSAELGRPGPDVFAQGGKADGDGTGKSAEWSPIEEPIVELGRYIVNLMLLAGYFLVSELLSSAYGTGVAEVYVTLETAEMNLVGHSSLVKTALSFALTEPKGNARIS